MGDSDPEMSWKRSHNLTSSVSWAMNLSWLIALREVADSGSYTRAANAMFMTQPAVSQQIRQLERVFSAKLVRIVGREVQLTEAGKKVYDLACLVEGEVESTRRSVRQLGGHGLITIASTPTPLLHMLPPLLHQFWSAHPEVEVRTMVRFGSEITDAVRTGLADIGIHGALYLDPGLEAIQLGTRELVCVASPDHPLVKESPVSPESVSHQRIAVTGASPATRKLIEEWFVEHSVVPENVFEVFSQEEIRIAAMQNMSIGFVDYETVVGDLASGSLVRLNLENFHLAVTTYVSHRRNLEPPAAWLIDDLMTQKADSPDGLNQGI